MLIDSHCHFNSLSKAKREEITSSKPDILLIDSSIDVNSSLASVHLSRKHDFIYSSLGFHPFCADDFSDEVFARYRKLIDDGERIVSIGEIGLDYKAKASLDKQELVFSSFLELAKEKDLPVVIHNRMDPADMDFFDVLGVIDRYFLDYKKVIFHCFSYPPQFLTKILEKGGFVSFSLNVLRKKKDIIESLKECPLDNLLLETDSPYMKIGKEPSTPLDIDKVYSCVAGIKALGPEELGEAVLSNAKRAFPKLI